MTSPPPGIHEHLLLNQTRFNLTLPERADIVAVGVLNDAYMKLGNEAAHLTLGNAFTGAQSIDGGLTLLNETPGAAAPALVLGVAAAGGRLTFYDPALIMTAGMWEDDGTALSPAPTVSQSVQLDPAGFLGVVNLRLRSGAGAGVIDRPGFEQQGGVLTEINAFPPQASPAGNTAYTIWGGNQGLPNLQAAYISLRTDYAANRGVIHTDNTFPNFTGYPGFDIEIGSAKRVAIPDSAPIALTGGVGADYWAGDLNMGLGTGVILRPWNPNQLSIPGAGGITVGGPVAIEGSNALIFPATGPWSITPSAIGLSVVGHVNVGSHNVTAQEYFALNRQLHLGAAGTDPTVRSDGSNIFYEAAAGAGSHLFNGPLNVMGGLSIEFNAALTAAAILGATRIDIGSPTGTLAMIVGSGGVGQLQAAQFSCNAGWSYAIEAMNSATPSQGQGYANLWIDGSAAAGKSNIRALEYDALAIVTNDALHAVSYDAPTSVSPPRDALPPLSALIPILIQPGGGTQALEQSYVTQVGFIADDWLPVLPEVVSVIEGEVRGMTYGRVVAIVFEALKQYIAQTDAHLASLDSHTGHGQGGAV